MMDAFKTGVFAVLAFGLAVSVMILDNDPALASEKPANLRHYLVEQEANLNELKEVKAQLVELGEEGSDLYLAVLNAIDTSQHLIDEAVYWQGGESLVTASREQKVH